MPYRAAKLARLEARITPQQKRAIARAAELEGSTVTDFVVRVVHQAASARIRAHESLSLQGSAQKAFVNALLNPPEPNRAALAAARRYKSRKGR